MDSSTTTELVDLPRAQDAVRAIFAEAARPPASLNRFYAAHSSHFQVVTKLKGEHFADLATWLFTLDHKVCPDRWCAFGPNASDQLLAFAYRKLAASSSEGLERLMSAFRAQDFRGPSASNRIAILKALLSRARKQPLSSNLMDGVKGLVDPDSPAVIYVRAPKGRAAEFKRDREIKSLYTLLVKTCEASESATGKAKRKSGKRTLSR